MPATTGGVVVMLGDDPRCRVSARVLCLPGVLLFLFATYLVAPGLAPAAAGSGGWYWPVGTESFSMSGWLDPRGPYYHVGQDMGASQGRPVYAVGAGTVWKVMTSAEGYGPGGGPGGVMVIIHTAATGRTFRAVYGHLQGIRFGEGDKVAAGTVVAYVNGFSPSHLHFGIHPGTSYPDDNPYRGHVPMSWADYGGWVDPVRYLRTHPRVIPYVAPALPATTVVTASVPTGVSVAGGEAYWSEQTDSGVARCVCDLATGERRSLPPGDVVPVFEAARYAVTLLVPPDTGFVVRDRRPALAMLPAHLTPRWGHPLWLRAQLTNAAGAPFQGARVQTLRWTGVRWTSVGGTVSTTDGRSLSHWVPLRRATLRLRFVPPSGARPAYLRAVSETVQVTPHVLLGVPLVPSAVSRGRRFAVTGHLWPVHSVGRGSVWLLLQRSSSGAWATVSRVVAITRDDDEGSRYARSLSLLTPGSWRVCAVHPEDRAHALTFSAWRRFTVD